MDPFLNVNWIKSKDALCFLLLLFLGVSFFIRVSLEVILNDASEGCISDCCGNFLPTVDAGVLLAVDKVGQTASTESVVTRLDRYWNAHDLIAEGASDLLLN